MVIAADDMRNPHMRVVGSNCKVVGRGSIGSQQDEIFDVEYTYYGLLALGHLSL